MASTRLIPGVVYALIAGCATQPLEPYPEVVLTVTTDAPVPMLAGRLRIDVYSQEGVWLDSRDFARLNPSDWPSSFSLHSRNEETEQSVLVRLRAYPDGKLRDYRGERYQSRPVGAPYDQMVEPPARMDGPRLVRDGVDVTPSTEPLPALAMDRLLRVTLHPGQVQNVGVVLRGRCVGTMANLSEQRTCIREENEQVGFDGWEATDESLDVPVGSFGAEDPCEIEPRRASSAQDGTPLHDEEVCVPGGIYLMGDERLTGGLSGASYDSIPRRFAQIPPLLVDRYEMTVGRYRAAKAAGFVYQVDPVANNGLLATEKESSAAECAYSTSPRPMGQDREAYALNCVPWDLARELCRFFGGDLLSEAQWEWVAAAAGRATPSPFPWGRAEPTCDNVIYHRSKESDACRQEGFPYGQRLVTDGKGDASAVYGLIGLGGGVVEWLQDAFAPYDAACWRGAPLFDPKCLNDNAQERVARGSGWQSPAMYLLSAARHSETGGDEVYAGLGLRCARLGRTAPP